jgi:hypothetical protein
LLARELKIRVTRDLDRFEAGHGGLLPARIDLHQDRAPRNTLTGPGGYARDVSLDLRLNVRGSA